MKSVGLGIIILLLLAVRQIAAQVSPTPTIEADIKDNSIRMRSTELERIKREAEKPVFESTAEREIRFAKVKENFENIQKLQDKIIKIYTRDKKIDFAKISVSASDITKNSFRLGENLFGEKSGLKAEDILQEKAKLTKVPDLIVALDNAIGDFVNSPIFKNRQVVDRKISEKAEDKLRQIIKLSDALSKESAKLK